MKTLIILEEISMFLFSILIFSSLEYAWWWFPALLLVPDFSMIGYTMGNKTGAAVYNLVHHKGVAITLLAAGFFLRNDGVILAGAILFGHSSLDRAFGYGLKYNTGFAFTHLGNIARNHAD